MKRMILILALVIIPVTNGYARTLQEKESIFINRVTQAITKKDKKAFQSLFCTPSGSRLPALFSIHSKSCFMEAHLEPPKEGLFKGITHDFILSICFLPPGTKEMCEIFPVKLGTNDLCILTDGKDGKH